MLVIFLVIVALWIFYKKYTEIYSQWSKRGIPYVPASFPFGSDKDIPLFRQYPGHVIDKMYKEKAGVPYFGMYQMRTPFLIVRDPEVVRLVLAKEFSHFRDRQGTKLLKDEILSHHLFALEGERWRALRVKMTPTFTSGKLKGMFPIFVNCAQALDDLLLQNADNNNNNVKDIFARFATDVICSCAFGLEVNSMGNRESEFRKLGERTATLSLRTKLRVMISRTFPSLVDLFKLRVFSKKTEDFLLKAISDVVEHRSKNNFKRNDFIDLLMQLKNGSLVDDMAAKEGDKSVQPIEMTLELMTAQCFVFFFAGFETSSSVQTFCLFELALNPEIQRRLQKEIDSKLEKHGGITYEAIQEMEYLDMVVSETMRKYPTLTFLSRRCTKPITMPAGHRLETGDTLLIPTWSLHHDPAYFPKPDTFDPERFSPENKGSIVPFTYLPFGEGPRNCIGMRFGLLQTKMGLITILRKYNLQPCEHTVIPIQLAANNTLSSPKHPVLLRVTKRAMVS